MKYIYEVETRFYFKNEEEIFDLFPFLNSCLDIKVDWKTTHYGLGLHNQDVVLRINYASINGTKVRSLGYKEPDTGEKINIRKEYDEKISQGIKNSRIMSILGGKKDYNNITEIKNELKRLGHESFMSFDGNSLAGKYEPLNIDFKLMHCSYLEYPLLLEIEKEASCIEEIRYREEEIKKFVAEYNLENKLIRKEPPTLLYESIFN